MFNEMLVCLEGSVSSQRALDMGIAMARTTRATLVGMAIVDTPTITAGTPTSIGGGAFKHQRDEALLADAAKKTHAWLDEFRQRCASENIPCRVREQSGVPAEEILTEMKQHDVTLLGRHTNFHFETHDGSCETRERLLHHASQPIIVVPETPVSQKPDDSQAVLIAYDGSEAAMRAIQAFGESGLGQGRPVHVLSVADDGETAWDLANAAGEVLRGFGLKVTLHNVVSTLRFPQVLLAEQQKLHAGLIVMGAYGRSRLAEFLSRSTTRAVLENALAPIYMHH